MEETLTIKSCKDYAERLALEIKWMQGHGMGVDTGYFVDAKPGINPYLNYNLLSKADIINAIIYEIGRNDCANSELDTSYIASPKRRGPYTEGLQALAQGMGTKITLL